MASTTAHVTICRYGGKGRRAGQNAGLGQASLEVGVEIEDARDGGGRQEKHGLGTAPAHEQWEKRREKRKTHARDSGEGGRTVAHGNRGD